MTKINFYHLTTTVLGKALPKLLEKVLENNLNALVLSSNTEQVEKLNKELWTYTTKVFLPHGSKEDGFSDQQPIYLTDDYNDNPNNAKVLAITYDAFSESSESLNNFERVIYIFDGNDDDQLLKARQKWKDFKLSDYNLVYWQQLKNGGWEQK